MGPHPAVAAIRLAVRRVLHDILDEHNRTPDEPRVATPDLHSSEHFEERRACDEQLLGNRTIAEHDERSTRSCPSRGGG